ncbi:hypothetical protein [Natrialba asiatica]|uniref:Uncharacterized protein n=1 Tax=Natrialba asiatica (strain ATCC 700177 / DSM 12278 / JCM 9576 / FERM P-10747 / NBRC 102637 / 172P1) TaxID=29540 RepID=M0AJS4_NATA1|nr:hypothetical protein [Natrialba asiatica]ELY98611.1 hypothetical protein C481_16832 [Natrialba asiatica DSM 12278]
MNWEPAVVFGLFVVACGLAASRARTEDWTVRRTIGVTVFLAGAAGGLFLDGLGTVSSTLSPWTEPVAAGVMLVGFVVAWTNADRSRTD